MFVSRKADVSYSNISLVVDGEVVVGNDGEGVPEEPTTEPTTEEATTTEQEIVE